MKSTEIGDTHPWSERNQTLILANGQGAFADSSRFAREHEIGKHR